MTPAALRSRRLALGLSQQAAAEALGISPRTYRYLEEGRTSRGLELPEIPLLYELAWQQVEQQIER